jgi:hypothetical protein
MEKINCIAEAKLYTEMQDVFRGNESGKRKRKLGSKNKKKNKCPKV